jgi:tetratricopeptide (TPR) repeat protein
MKNCIFRNRLKIYILFVFIGITFLPSYTNPCYSQNNTNEAGYKTTIQQADQALAAKDYAGALLLYKKASQAKPDDNYTAGKINEINTILDINPDSKAQLFEDLILKAENLFKQKDYPKAKSEYQKALAIDPTSQFPKDRLTQINALYSDPEDLAIFNQAIATGDNALAKSDFDKAIQSYETALAVKPNTKSVKDKITAAKKQQSEYKLRTEQSAKSIASADKLFQAGKRVEARTEYQNALDLIPDNQHAKLKILEIDNFASNQNALQNAYDISIEQADQFYINRDFASARLKYQEALNAKPEARYPKEMLEKTKSGESQLQSDQQKYDAALASAESFLKSADYEAALIGFKSALVIKPAETYPKTKITDIQKLIGERTSRKEAFDIAIKNGDLSLSENKYDAALGHYRNALSLLPGEKYPSQKIEEITVITGKQKESDENYRKFLAEADKQFKQNKFEEAISSYTKALEIKPEETYPQQKITEAQSKLVALKSKEENFATAVANGDRLFSESKYNEAFDAYELSLTIRPGEEYPISKIAEINFILGKQKSDSDKYTQAIEKGDKALVSGNYNLAIRLFQDALTIKPSEQYPKEKLIEIKNTVATQQQTDEKYATAIKTGDQLFAGKEFSRALSAYSEAMELKKNEKYPQDQIAKINKSLGDMQSVEENYKQAIAEADKNFNNQKFNEAVTSYKKASVIKPSETYPKSQVEKINATLAAQTKLDGEYSAVITSADKLFAAKKYDDAIAEFRKALTLKPEEKYPAEKITESEKLIYDIKILQESYNKAIADGDKFLSDKDYLSSLASFKSAKTLKPGEAYPSQKISEVQFILDKDKAEGERYQDAVMQADKLFADKKYNEALEPYQQAVKIKPNEKYPQDQLSEINKLIAAEKKLADDYQKAITDADNRLKAGQYDEARNLYSSATAFKPSEKLPKDKIAEIDGILAAIQLKEQNYTKAISDGDESFTGKRYLEAIAFYNAASAIKPAETYPKSQVEKTNSLLAEQQKLDNNFLAVVTSADQFFEEKKYNEAIADYRKALVLKPAEKYPSEKIAEAEKQIADIKAIQESYDKAIAEGDKKLAAKDYENALLSFKSANASKPAETYPLKKISEIQTVIDKQKAESASYQQAIVVADKFFADQKYREALEPYQRASTIKAEEKYPQDQIAQINAILAGQKKIDEDYQKLLTDADQQLKTGKYDDARSLYTNAGTLKPLEKLPKDKIAEIDAILAGLKLKEENYTKAINTAAEFYSAKNLQGAIKSYEEALLIKPAEKYPQERITAIKTETKAIDENYSKAIALGDSKLAAKNLMEALNAYQNAAEIKPGEEYPKTKIAGINSSLLAQKEEQDKMYSSYVAEGDQLFGIKDYAGANSAFAKATGIKPNETYPKQRIIEITKITEDIELARRAEYNKALGEADKLYNTKVFDLAIDAYEAAAKINPNDSYPVQQIGKIRKYMSEHAIQDLFSQTLIISEGNEKKFTFSAIEPRLRKNNYILLKARSTGKTVPKVYMNYGKDNTKNGGIVLRSLDKSTISDYLIRISVQDKWYREDNNWISLSVETGDIEITKVQIAVGDE